MARGELSNGLVEAGNVFQDDSHLQSLVLVGSDASLTENGYVAYDSDRVTRQLRPLAWFRQPWRWLVVVEVAAVVVVEVAAVATGAVWAAVALAAAVFTAAAWAAAAVAVSTVAALVVAASEEAVSVAEASLADFMVAVVSKEVDFVVVNCAAVVFVIAASGDVSASTRTTTMTTTLTTIRTAIIRMSPAIHTLTTAVAMWSSGACMAGACNPVRCAVDGLS